MHHINHMHNKITVGRTTNKISTRHNNHTLKEGVVETSEEEVEEEALLEGEVRLHAITVDNQVTMPEIAWNLQGHVHTVKDKTIMWRNVLSLLQSGKQGPSQVLPLCRIQTQILILT